MLNVHRLRYSTMSDVTRIPDRAQQGEAHAAEVLLLLVDEELRKLGAYERCPTRLPDTPSNPPRWFMKPPSFGTSAAARSP